MQLHHVLGRRNPALLEERNNQKLERAGQLRTPTLESLCPWLDSVGFMCAFCPLVTPMLILLLQS